MRGATIRAAEREAVTSTVVIIDGAAFDLADSALERAVAGRPLDSDLSAAEAALPASPRSCPGQEQAGKRWLAGRCAAVTWPQAGW